MFTIYRVVNLVCDGGCMAELEGMMLGQGERTAKAKRILIKDAREAGWLVIAPDDGFAQRETFLCPECKGDTL